jgi:hypothetical protein
LLRKTRKAVQIKYQPMQTLGRSESKKPLKKYLAQNISLFLAGLSDEIMLVEYPIKKTVTAYQGKNLSEKNSRITILHQW